MLLRHERSWATYLSVLFLSLCFLAGVERYQAKERNAMVTERAKRQATATMTVALSTMRRVQREQRVRTQEVTLPAAPPPPPPPPARPPSAPPVIAPPAQDSFPSFDRAMYPVSRVPNWGAMRTPQEWERTYSELSAEDFVRLPRYDLKVLTRPLSDLTHPILPEHIPPLTAKLTYSTRYYGAYDLDAGEFTGMHPGIDLKLAFGTPVGALAGGRVHAVSADANMGLFVMVEHRLPDGGTAFSLYGHLDAARVTEGQAVEPGQVIGTVGMSGNTTAPHVHLQVDRDDGRRPHLRYWPDGSVSRSAADRSTINPIVFIERYRGG